VLRCERSERFTPCRTSRCAGHVLRCSSREAMASELVSNPAARRMNGFVAGNEMARRPD
jgi:hypothetical protein